jgi:hypothetical protein
VVAKSSHHLFLFLFLRVVLLEFNLINWEGFPIVCMRMARSLSILFFLFCLCSFLCGRVSGDINTVVNGTGFMCCDENTANNFTPGKLGPTFDWRDSTLEIWLGVGMYTMKKRKKREEEEKLANSLFVLPVLVVFVFFFLVLVPVLVLPFSHSCESPRLVSLFTDCTSLLSLSSGNIRNMFVFHSTPVLNWDQTAPSPVRLQWSNAYRMEATVYVNTNQEYRGRLALLSPFLPSIRPYSSILLFVLLLVLLLPLLSPSLLFRSPLRFGLHLLLPDLFSFPLHTIVKTDNVSDGTIFEWHHFAVVRESASNSLSIYHNGMLNSANNSAFLANEYDNTDPFYLCPSDSSFSGFHLITEVRLWNISRSTSEIALNWQDRVVGNEPFLEQYWPLIANLNSGVGGGTTLSGGIPAFSSSATCDIVYNTLVNVPTTTPTPTPTSSPSLSISLSQSSTLSISLSATGSKTVTASLSPSSSLSKTTSGTLTPSLSVSKTTTATVILSASRSQSSSVARSISTTRTPSFTRLSPSHSHSPTQTPTLSRSGAVVSISESFPQPSASLLTSLPHSFVPIPSSPKETQTPESTPTPPPPPSPTPTPIIVGSNCEKVMCPDRTCKSHASKCESLSGNDDNNGKGIHESNYTLGEDTRNKSVEIVILSKDQKTVIGTATFPPDSIQVGWTLVVSDGKEEEAKLKGKEN